MLIDVKRGELVYLGQSIGYEVSELTPAILVNKRTFYDWSAACRYAKKVIDRRNKV
jgi:hypothetical protein